MISIDSGEYLGKTYMEVENVPATLSVRELEGRERVRYEISILRRHISASAMLWLQEKNACGIDQNRYLKIRWIWTDAVSLPVHRRA